MIPEELGPGTIVANVTAEDPDDQGFTSFLLYSITTVNSYFMINQCKLLTHTHYSCTSFNSTIWIVFQIFYVSFDLGMPFCVEYHKLPG